MQARGELGSSSVTLQRTPTAGRGVRPSVQESLSAVVPAHLQTVVLQRVERCEEEVVLDALPVLLGVPEDGRRGVRYGHGRRSDTSQRCCRT